MSLRSWRSAAAAVALGGVALLGTAPESNAGGVLAVKRFLIGTLQPNTFEFVATGARGTQNAYRDNVLMFVFSEPVDFTTLDKRTVKIGIPASGGLFIDAEGSFYRYTTYRRDESSPTDYLLDRVYRNRIIFDPTSRQEPQLNQNPYGLDVNSTYTVTVPGIDSGTTKVVRSTKGAYNLTTFSTSFRTGDKYLQDYVQPSLVKIEGNDAPNVPLDGRPQPGNQGVDSRADIIATFSEPMLPSTFDVNSTFRVFNVNQNRYVSGTIRGSPDGLSFTFRPAFGYGRGPYNMRVTLSTALTDRQGNPLLKSVVANFTTEFDPFAPNYDEVNEPFDFTTYADFTYTRTYDQASWNGWIGPNPPATNNTNRDLGLLAGVFGAKVLEVNFNGSVQSGYAAPWWNSAVHCQNLYSPSHMGSSAKTVNGYAWRHYINGGRATGTTHSVTIQFGHNTAGNLSTNFTGSFSDTPLTVFTGSYSPNTSDIEWINGATFTANWPYNGSGHVVLDHNQTSGGGVNYWRYTSSGQGGTTMVDTLNGATVARWNHDVRFFYLVDKSEAQSLWYDTNQKNAVWLDPIITNTVPAGTVATVLFQGGHESPLIPNTVDQATLSAWTTDPLTNLGGNRYIRFHVDFTSNLASSQKATIDQIKLPYIFY